MRLAQLPKIASNHVNLSAPAIVEWAARGQQFLPLVIRQVALHAVVEGDRLVVRGLHFVPGEGDDCAVTVLALDLFDHCWSRKHRVFVVPGGEAKILPKESWVFAGQVVSQVSPAR